MDSDRLLKVYGALMWSISRCLGGKTAVPKVYVGSFWDGPRRHPDDRYDVPCPLTPFLCGVCVVCVFSRLCLGEDLFFFASSGVSKRRQ